MASLSSVHPMHTHVFCILRIRILFMTYTDFIVWKYGFGMQGWCAHFLPILGGANIAKQEAKWENKSHEKQHKRRKFGCQGVSQFIITIKWVCTHSSSNSQNRLTCDFHELPCYLVDMWLVLLLYLKKIKPGNREMKNSTLFAFH